jgi:hypothetical protein
LDIGDSLDNCDADLRGARCCDAARASTASLNVGSTGRR